MQTNLTFSNYIVKSTFFSILTIKIPKGTGGAKTYGFLIVNSKHLSVKSIFGQTTSFLSSLSSLLIKTLKTSCLYEIEISFKKIQQSDWEKK